MRKSDNDKLFSRLLQILKILSDGQEPTLKELAEKFNVDTRTIRRDISERLSFFPVDLKDGIVHVAPGYSILRSGLEDDELFTAELAFSAINGMNPKVDEQLQTIRAKLSRPLFFSPYHVKAELFEKINLDQSLLNKIEDAITKKNVAKVTSNEITTRVFP